MISVVIIANQTNERNFRRNLVQLEIDRMEGFTVTALSSKVEDALTASPGTYIDILILKPSESERIYFNQLDAIARFRKANPQKGPNSVMIISENITPDACKTLSDADIMYMFVGTYEAHKIAEKLEKIFEKKIHKETEEIELIKLRFAEKIKATLIGFGIYPSSAGFKYAVEAALTLRFATEEKQFTKGIYPSIGKKYGKSESSVERALRKTAATASESQVWKELYPEQTKKPTNSEFISILIESDPAL